MDRKTKQQKSKQKHLKRDVSEVREEWPVDTEVAQTQITTFVQASVAPDPETQSTAAREKKKKSTQGAFTCQPARNRKLELHAAQASEIPEETSFLLMAESEFGANMKESMVPLNQPSRLMVS